MLLLAPLALADDAEFRVRDISLGVGLSAGGVGGELGISPAYSAIFEAGTQGARVGVGLSGAPLINAAGPVDYFMPMVVGVELDGAFGTDQVRAGPSLMTWAFIPVAVGARLGWEAPHRGKLASFGVEGRGYWFHHLIPGVVGPEYEGWMGTVEATIDWSFGT